MLTVEMNICYDCYCDTCCLDVAAAAVVVVGDTSKRTEESGRRMKDMDTTKDMTGMMLETRRHPHPMKKQKK